MVVPSIVTVLPVGVPVVEVDEVVVVVVGVVVLSSSLAQ